MPLWWDQEIPVQLETNCYDAKLQSSHQGLECHNRNVFLHVKHNIFEIPNLRPSQNHGIPKI